MIAQTTASREEDVNDILRNEAYEQPSTGSYSIQDRITSLIDEEITPTQGIDLSRNEARMVDEPVAEPIALQVEQSETLKQAKQKIKAALDKSAREKQEAELKRKKEVEEANKLKAEEDAKRKAEEEASKLHSADPETDNMFRLIDEVASEQEN